MRAWLREKEILDRDRSGRVNGLRRITHLRWLAVLCVLVGAPSLAQSAPNAERMAKAIISSQGENGPTALHWSEKTGLLLAGMDAAWYNSADGDDFRFVKQAVDAYLASKSTTASPQPTPADALMGSQLLFLYRVTLKPEYFRAASIERQRALAACGGLTNGDQAVTQKDSANLCTAQPFLAEYARVFDSPQDFGTVTASFAKMEPAIETSFDTGKEKESGNASRELASLVDSLPYFTQNNPGRAQLLAILHRMADAIRQHQDTKTGLLYVAEQGSTASRSDDLAFSNCLLIYGILKAVRLGYLPSQDAAAAERAWRSVEQRFVHMDASGGMHLVDMAHSINTAGGENAGPGSSVDDVQLNGEGALLLAATEADLAPTATLAQGKKVLLDAWYNSQQRTNAAGQTEYFHYKWSDYTDSGYALLGHLFRSFGAETDTLYSPPTSANLKGASVYIIASPDIPIKNPNPQYLNNPEAAAIADWVKQGGVLVMMENDPPNADIDHLNLLADRFGIHFDNVLHHHILGEHVEDGTMHVTPGGPLFRHEHTLYMKDTCAISLQAPAVALFRDRGDVVMATAKYGHGTVFAAVDPWLYNEYTDGRKNPKIYGQFDNFAGGREFVHWLLLQIPGEE